MSIPCPNTRPHPQHGECFGVMRRATAAEIAQARAWVEHVFEGAESAEAEHEYAQALEVLIHANGGRWAEPLAAPAPDPLSVAVLDAATAWRREVAGEHPADMSARENALAAAVDAMLAARHTLRQSLTAE